MSSDDVPDIGLPVGRIVGVVFLLLVVSASALGAVYTVDQGERGVVTRNGAVVGSVDEGLHFKIPLIDAVHRYDVRSKAYTMSSKSGEGSGTSGERVSRDDSIDALSSEGMELKIDATVRYHIVPGDVTQLYTNVAIDEAGIVEKIVRPTSRAAIRDCASNYKGLAVYSSERDSFQSCVNEKISEEFEQNGVALEAVQIRSINLPESVIEAINEKQAAEKRVEKKEAEIQIAEKEKEKAEIEAEAEARRIQIKGRALRQNPQVLQLRYIEALKTGNTVYVPTDGGNFMLTREIASGGNQTVVDGTANGTATGTTNGTGTGTTNSTTG
jgi:regulator of protease activity HflC (stomatin/prohibitin superfamily)